MQVAEDQRYALLEYVSHLTAKDYEATLNDLIVLGFIPKEIGEDPAKVISFCSSYRQMLYQSGPEYSARIFVFDRSWEQWLIVGSRLVVIVAS